MTISAEGASGNAVLALADGATAPVSALSEGRFRYNTAASRLEFSENTSPWTPFSALAGFWGQTGTVIHPITLTDEVVVGAAGVVGTEQFRVVGGSLFEGSVTIAAGGTNVFQEFGSGSTAPVSALSRGRFRYNEVSQQFEVSENGGIYVPLFAGGTSTAVDSATVYNCPGTVAVNDVVSLTAADAVDKADADLVSARPAIGIVAAKPTALTCKLRYIGELGGFGALTPGATYYLSTTPGGIVTPAPTGSGVLRQVIGDARNATTLVVDIERGALLLA